MRILHIIPDLRKGGAERLVLDICIQLSYYAEHDVRLLTFSKHNDYSYLSEKINCVVVPASVQLSLTKKNIITVGKLQQYINEFNPDIIHTHLFEAEIVSRLCYYPQAKWFSHCHDNMTQFENFSWSTILNKRKITNFFEKQYLLKQYRKNKGTHFIAISNDAKQYFEKTMPQYPITLLHNAIDYKRFFKERTFENHGRKLRLINVGSMVDKKNQSFLLEVAMALKQNNLDFELHFLGDGINRRKLEQHAVSLKLQKEVFFHGNVNNVEEYLWQADIYVHSATYEPLGLVLLEAMAAGLPVVALDGGGNRDLIEQDKNGYILNTLDIDLFSRKIKCLWSDKAKYIEVSTYAQSFAEKFDISIYVERLLAIYKS